MPLVNEQDVDWEETERGPTRFRRKPLSRAANLGPDPGLGCSLYELPPGGRSWPYHYHAANAEALFVRSGTGRIRTDDGERPLEPGDYVPLPAGPVGAHRIINDGEGPLRYLALSTMREPDVTVYPDSEKLGVYVGSPPGGQSARPVEGYYRLEDAVDYWEGE